METLYTLETQMGKLTSNGAHYFIWLSLATMLFFLLSSMEKRPFISENHGGNRERWG